MSEKLAILDESSDSDEELKINKGYADRYNIWRNKEELQKYKDLKKEDDDSESSSESEEETPEFDEEFFRALSLLKGKDPRIYDKNYELFTKTEVKKKKTEKEKPIFMKDYERTLVLKRGGKLSDDDDEPMSSKVPTYTEEQENLQKSFQEVLKDSDDDDDDENDLLKVRTKSKKEEEEDESDYLKWLKGEEKEVADDIKKDLSYLRNYWNDPKLDEGEKFLRDYILNKRYLEDDDAEIPTYEELTSGMLSDDEKMLEEQEKFELKYNFRYEEPDEEYIKRYPRTIGDSLRRENNKRKQKREEKTERKKKEREQRKEELKRLKALKRKEIEEKFSKLKQISGQEELNLNESDMESDFDPDKHDKKMQEMFNDDYYNVDESQKPEFPYDEELDSENWNTWDRKKIVDDDDEKDVDQDIDTTESDPVNDQQESEANPQTDFAEEMIGATLPKKKMKKKSLFAKVLSQPKPVYDPDGKSFDEYLDEYYKLDYEDVIGDLPVRYKYRKVIPNDFGLTVDEILAADDRELNRWCSVKKTCQYRNDDEEIYDVQAYKKKSQNILGKKKVLSSLFVPKDPPNEAGDSSFNENKITNRTVDQANDDKEAKQNRSESNKKKKSKKNKEKLNILHSNLEPGDRNLPGSSKLTENDDDSISELVDSKKKKRNYSDQEDNCTKEENSYSVQSTGKEDSIFEQQLKRKKIKKIEINALDRNFKQEVKPDLESKRNEKDIFHSKVSADSDNAESESKAFNELSSSSGIVSESLPQVAKRKKKKKKRKNKLGFQDVAQDSRPKVNNFKGNKPKGNQSSDKRLGLSDERLAAYGLNPKKFKNRIIHSQK